MQRAFLIPPTATGDLLAIMPVDHIQFALVPQRGITLVVGWAGWIQFVEESTQLRQLLLVKRGRVAVPTHLVLHRPKDNAWVVGVILHDAAHLLSGSLPILGSIRSLLGTRAVNAGLDGYENTHLISDCQEPLIVHIGVEARVVHVGVAHHAEPLPHP